MTNITDKPEIDAKLQKHLARLISEEYFAGELYNLFANATCPEEKQIVNGIFTETAKDEHEDHMQGMISWCDAFGYRYPATYHEFKKCSGENAVKQFKGFKPGKRADYYLNEAIKSEIDAIKSYKWAIDECDTSDKQEIASILLKNYYDEQEHLESFKFLLGSYL